MWSISCQHPGSGPLTTATVRGGQGHRPALELGSLSRDHSVLAPKAEQGLLNTLTAPSPQTRWETPGSGTHWGSS